MARAVKFRLDKKQDLHNVYAQINAIDNVTDLSTVAHQRHHWRLMRQIMWHKLATAEILDIGAAHYQGYVKQAAVGHPNADEEALMLATDSGYWRVIEIIFNHPDCTTRVLELLTKNKYEDVRERARLKLKL